MWASAPAKNNYGCRGRCLHRPEKKGMKQMEITLTSSNFDAEVTKSDKPVLVDFWATWCGPCRMVAPVIEQLAKDYDGKIKVGKVNVDDEGSLAAQFGIVSIPTIIMFVNGKPVDKLVGAHSSDDFEDMIEKYL